MIIICPWCEKKFQVDETLIPEKGRLLKCGSCDKTWFFNKNDNNDIQQISEEFSIKDNSNNEKPKYSNKKNEKVVSKNSDYSTKKRSELVKYNSKSNFSFVKLLNYLIVSIVSFIALIIILDTFKSPLSIIIPNIELILYNLFETLRDMTLFAKDLN